MWRSHQFNLTAKINCLVMSRDLAGGVGVMAGNRKDPMDDRLVEIEKRIEAATGEPWHWTGDRVPDLIGFHHKGEALYKTFVVEAAHEGECACRSKCQLDLFVSDADADFIAHAREDVPWLLARIRELETELSRGVAGDSGKEPK